MSCHASASSPYTLAELLQRRNRPSQRSSTLGAISRGLGSSSPPPIVTPASPSSTSNPMMLRSTRLCQRGCTLVASLCYSAFMSIPQGSFAMELLFVHLVRRSGAKQNLRIFFLWCLFRRKNVGILFTWTSFSN